MNKKPGYSRSNNLLWICLPTALFICMLSFGSAATVIAAGGDPEWQYRDSQSGKQTAMAAAIDSATGELVITGYTDTNGDDFYTVKINAAGNGLLWTAPAFDVNGGQDQAVAVAIDSQGNVIVAGHVTNADNNIDFHTVKYNSSSGAVIWEKTYSGSSNGDDYAVTMVIDYLDNIYVGGFTPGTNGKDDCLLIKYSPNGSQMWAETYNNSVDNEHDRIAAVTAGPDGVAFTGKSLSSDINKGWEILTVKYDFNGLKLWDTIRSGSSGNDEGVAVEMDSSGHVIVTGTVLNATLDTDIYTVRYNGATGDVMSAMEMTYSDPNGGADQPRDLVVDANDDIFITGSSLTATGLIDFVTLRYSGIDGTETWKKIYSSGGNNTDIPTSLVVNDVSVYVTGYTHIDASGDDDFTTVKYKKDNGFELWPSAATYNNTAVNKDDLAIYVSLDANGKVYVAGWSDKSTTAAQDYDYYALRYDPGDLIKPTNLAATVVDENTIDLSWVDNSSAPNETEYQIERKIGLNGTYAQINTVGQDITTYQDSGLTPHIKYYYRVRGYRSILGEYSHYSNEDYAKTTLVSINTNPPWVFLYNGPDDSDDEARDIGIGPDLNPVITGYSTISAGFDYYTVKLQHDLIISDASSVSLDLNGDGLADIKADFSTPLATDSTVVFDTTLAGAVIPNTHTGDAAGNTTLNIVTVPENNEDKINQDANITLTWNNTTTLWLLTDNGGYSGAVILAEYVGQLWDDNYDDPGNGEDLAQCLAVDNNNDVIVSGSSLLFSGGSGSTIDVLTRKYPSSGPPPFGDPFIWESQYNGSSSGDDYAQAIEAVADGSGNVAVAGYGQNLSGNNDIYVIYYLADGTLLWADDYDYAAGDDRPVAVTFDPDGDIIMTGRVMISGAYSIVTRKYCTLGTSSACSASSKVAGEIIWTTIHDSGNGTDEPAGIVTDSNGNVYVAGFVTNVVGNTDTYLAKLDSTTGNEAWGAPISENGPGNGNDRINAIEMDSNDDEFTVAATWNLGASNSEFRLTRYTTDGIPVWNQIFDSAATDDRVQAMGMDRSGNICVAGTRETAGSTDVIAIKYDYAGEIIGATSFDGGQTPALNDEAVAVAVNQLGEAFVAGNTSKPFAGFDYLVLRCEGNVLQAPSPFTATSYYLSADFTWINNAPEADSFMMMAKVGTCPILDTDTTWMQQTFGPTAVSHTETGLAMGLTYCFRLKASTATGDDSRWLYQQIRTSRPPAPENLVATAVNTTRVQLSWIDGINGEESFKIERCNDTAANCSTVDTNFIYLDNAVANSVSYDDPTACPGETYTYRVRAVHTLWGEEPLWAYSETTTPIPSSPVTTSIVSQSEGRLDLTWTDTNGDETGFNIYRCQGVGCTIDTANDPPIASVTAPADSHAALKMNEAAWTAGNPDVIDSSGNNNHGTPMGDAQRGMFDGDDDYITLGDIDELDAPAAFSAELRFRRNAETGSATNHTINNVLIAQSSAGSNDNFEIGTEGTFIELYLDTAGDVDETKSVEFGLAVDAGIKDNIWYHLVFTYDKDAGDGNEAKLYLDGVLLTQWSDPDGLLADSGTSQLTLGMARPDGEAVTPTGLWGDFDGEFDEVTFYNRALSATEVASHFANGNIPTSYTDSILNPNETYRYLVTAFKTTPTTCGTEPGWEGTAGSYDQGTTSAITAPILISAAPDTVENTTNINLSWQDNTEFEENFIVERCTGDCTGSFVVNDSLTAGPNPGKGGTVNWTDTTACSGTYTYRVKAVRTTAPVWSTASSAAELVATTVSGAVPLINSATRLNEEEILLSWIDNSSDETAYTIERCIGASCTDVSAPTFTGTGAVNFTDNRLTPDTTYSYRVKADKNAGICSWQTAFTAQVSANTDITTPFNLTSSLPTTTQIDLSWTDPTAHETGFVLERCNGDCSGSFIIDQSYAVDADVTNYSDTSVCENTQYSYRVKAIDQDFAGGMNSCWTKRQKITITPFTADTVIQFTVNFIAGMQNDFRDVRFYSFTDGTESDGTVLPYWIDREIDGTSMDVWLRTPASGDQIYMYYGNSLAVEADTSGYTVFDFFDDFQGTVIDTAKWQENDDAQNEIYQDDGLYLFYKDTSYLSLISQVTFNRVDEPVVYIRWVPLSGTSHRWFGGWETDQTTSTALGDFAHSFGLYNTYVNYTYELNVNRGRDYVRYYDYNYQYDSKVEVFKNGGARSYLRGGFNHTNATYKHLNWDPVKDTTVLTTPDLVTADPLRIGVLQYNSMTLIHSIGVLTNPPDLPTVDFTVASDPTCNDLPYVWESNYSATITPTSAAAAPPTSFTATPLSESEIKLTWTDQTSDDTGFILERCQGTDAECIAAPAPNFDWSMTVPGSVTPALQLHMDESFWDGTVNEVQDSAGTNHGRSYNGANTVAGGVSGRAGNFGASDFVQLNSNVTLSRFGATLSWWQKPAITTDTGLFSIGSSGSLSSIIESRSSMIYAETNLNCNQFDFSGVTKTTTGAWYTIVFDNEHAYLYKDGVFVKEATNYGTNDCGGAAVDLMLADTTLRYIGAPTGYSTTNYRGLIDEVTVFDYALSAIDIAYQYGSFEEYTDTGLALSTEYTYRLRAFKDNSTCTWDTGDTVRVTASTLAPPPPTNLAATPVDTTTIDLVWDDNTGSNTAFTIERSFWNGSSWDAPVFLGPANGNDIIFSDTEACENTQYRYRVRAAKEAFIVGGTGLSNDGGDTWPRRAPVQITGFLPNSVTEITVQFDPDMQTDFDDLRFFDETAGQELAQYITYRLDSDTAQILFKTGTNDNITMYYGNQSATDVSDGAAIFDFHDDFQGTTIDTAKWIENDVDDKITQNNGLNLAYVNSSWNAGLISQQTYARTAGKTLLMQVNVQNGSGNDYFALGWTHNQTTSLSYATLRHGYYWNNFTQVRSYNPWFYGAAYTAADYLLKVELNAAGAKYYIQGGPYSDMTLLTENTSFSDDPLRIQIAQSSQQARIELIAVYDPGATATLGTEESGLVADGWETIFAEATATTVAKVTPTLTSVSRISETRVDLSWIDTNNDETNIELYRCVGAACQTIIIAPGTSSYSNAGLQPATTYCYQVRAVKTGPSCGWQTAYDPAVALCATTSISDPVLPPTVGASTDPSNTTQVALKWTDNSETESDFTIWRCADDTPLDCTNDTNFSNIHTAGSNQNNWADNSVCSGQTYTYKIQAISDGLPVNGFSNNGGGTWTRKIKLNFDTFAPDSTAFVTIPYDVDMQADFDDLRFVDDGDGTELAYAIDGKTNGVEAKVWFQTGTSDTVNVYYGNPNASSSAVAATTVFTNALFYDDFQGTAIDSTKWVEIDPNGQISQNNALQLEYVDSLWNAALISQQTFTRKPGTLLYMKIRPENGPSGDYFVAGWEKNQTTNPDRNQLMYGYAFWNTTFYVSTGGSFAYPVHSNSYAFDTDYEFKIELKAAGATSYKRTVGSTDWLLGQDNSSYSDNPLRIGITQDSAQAKVKFVAVVTTPVVTLGQEELTSLAVWNSGRSGADSATTDLYTLPSMDQGNTVGATETSNQVAWTDTNPDESYFRIYRGAADCTGFVEIGQTAGPDILTFIDTGADLGGQLAYNTTYCYQVQAHKDTGGCDWDTGFNNTATATTDIPIPANLTATAIGTTRIDLAWDDTTSSETGFIVDRCTGDKTWCDGDPGTRFSQLDAVGAGVKNYTDSSVCPATTYSYRVKADRSGEWTSGPSLTADATTSGLPTAPSNLALTEVYDQYNDSRQIDLVWTDTNPDEDGFVIERCDQTTWGDCDTADTNFSPIRYLASHDEFNTQINPLLWDQYGCLGTSCLDTPLPINFSDATGSAKVYYNSGAAVLETTTSPTVGTSWNSAGFSLASPESLGSGDIDLQFDWDLPTVVIPETMAQDKNHIYVRLLMNIGLDRVIIDRDVSPGGGYYWGQLKLNDASYPFYIPGITDTSGKFRVTRTGGTITLYKWDWNTEDWEILVSQAGADIGSAPSNIQIYQSSDQSDSATVALKTVIDNFRINSGIVTSYSDIDTLAGSTDYYYQVRTFKETTCPAWDGLYTLKQNEMTNPASPTLSVAALGSRKIELTWVDNAIDEQGFEIEKQIFGGKFIKIGDVGPNSEAYIDTTNLAPDTLYTYRVRTYRDNYTSYSAYSNESSVKTDVVGGGLLDDTTCP